MLGLGELETSVSAAPPPDPEAFPLPGLSREGLSNAIKTPISFWLHSSKAFLFGLWRPTDV